jgi:hypothetical protein
MQVDLFHRVISQTTRNFLMTEPAISFALALLAANKKRLLELRTGL